MSRSPRIPSPPSRELLLAVRAELEEGERLAWAGAPDPEAMERERPDSLKWDAVAIIGGGYAVIGGGVMTFRTGLWWWMSIPIALLVLSLAGFFIVKWFKARARKVVEGTVYGVSTRRALIVQTYPRLRVMALPIAEITDVTLSAERDGYADLQLHIGPEPLLFPGLDEPERARNQILRVVRDPQAAEQELAAAESYAMQMSRLMARPSM